MTLEKLSESRIFTALEGRVAAIEAKPPTIQGDGFQINDEAGTGPAVVVNNAEAYSGTGTATSGAPRTIWGTNAPSGDDACFLICRNLNGANLFSHAQRDESTFISSSTGAYASWDSAFTVTGTIHYNHMRSFQSRPIYAASGLIDEIAGFVFQPTMTNGQAGVVYGMRIVDCARSGGAVINGQQTGIFCEQLTGAVGGNYTLYGLGGDFYNNGTMQIAGYLTGVTDLTASGQAVVRSYHATSWAGSSYHIGGGALLANLYGGAAYGAVQSYSFDGTTYAGKGLALNPDGGQVIVGAAVPASGTPFEVAGTIGPHADNASDLGTASFRFRTVYAGTGTINTSDEAAKQDIGAIPDDWLDAWGSVSWSRYRFKDAVASKGDTARWHIGLVAQRVRDAFAAIDVDATAIGLLCYDAWEERRIPEMHSVNKTRMVPGDVHTSEEYEEELWVPLTREPTADDVVREILIETKAGPLRSLAVRTVRTAYRAKIEPGLVPESYDEAEPVLNDDGSPKETVVPAGERWGLRYDECLAIEAAWQRRELDRMKKALKPSKAS